MITNPRTSFPESPSLLPRFILACSVLAAMLWLMGCGSKGTATSSTGTTSTTTTLTASPSSATVGTAITFTATVTPSAATGKVSFYDGTTSTTLGTSTLSSGTATLSTSALATGTHSVTATYAGDTTYSSSTSAAVTITITAATTTSSSSCGLGTADYVLSSGSATQSGQTYSATSEDESGVCAENYGTSLTLTSPTITTSGDTSSTDNSSFYGLNAALLAYGSSASTDSGATITISNGSITTTGSGANGVFASGLGSTVNITGTTITASGGNAHGLDAAEAGTLNITGVTATTSGASGSVIATDRGGGIVTISGGTYKTSGERSAGIYSTGTVTCSNSASFTTSNAEGIVVEGSNSVTSKACTYNSTNATDNRSIFIYNSESGDASAGTGTLTMTGDSYTWNSTSSPLFYVTNTTADIVLNGVVFTNNSTALLTAEANASWGTTGSNGGKVTLTAIGQSLTGAIVIDSISTLTMTLSDSSAYSGALNAADTASSVTLTLDATSTWNVLGDSYVTVLNDTSEISGTTINNITGNGYTVYYVSSSNSALGGETYTLNGGGYLKPM